MLWAALGVFTLVVNSPLILGFVDLFLWIFTGSNTGIIPWMESRGFFAFVVPMLIDTVLVMMLPGIDIIVDDNT